MSAQALEGLLVIDLCRAGPGMMGTQHLADYGADVISIQEPGYAERRIGQSGVEPTFMRGSRRNKRSILLSLKSEEGRGVFYRMAERADVIMESNRPGVAKRLGVDYPTIKAVNPRIIYCSLSGYGQYGPYADLPGHDFNYQGVGGSVYIDEKGEPVMPTYIQADMNAAWNGCVSILIALYARQRTGRGQFIDIAFSDGAVTLQKGGRDPNMTGADPCYNVYQCGDGKYLALGIREPWFWERLCQLVGKPEWIAHQRPQGELKKEMFTFFRNTFRSKPQAEWFRILQENDNQASPLHSNWREVAEDPHNRAREMILEVINPFTGQKEVEPGFVYKFSETPGEVRIQPSVMGSYTDEVLFELGYTNKEVADLRTAGVIG